MIAAAIPDGSITEAQLAITYTPVDAQILTWDATDSILQWVSPGGGGTDEYVDSLSTTLAANELTIALGRTETLADLCDITQVIACAGLSGGGDFGPVTLGIAAGGVTYVALSTDAISGVRRGLRTGYYILPDDVGGTAHAITLITGDKLTSIEDGMLFAFRPETNNKGDVKVLVDGLTAGRVLKSGGTAGEIPELEVDDFVSGYPVDIQVITGEFIITDTIWGNAGNRNVGTDIGDDVQVRSTGKVNARVLGGVAAEFGVPLVRVTGTDAPMDWRELTVSGIADDDITESKLDANNNITHTQVLSRNTTTSQFM